MSMFKSIVSMIASSFLSEVADIVKKIDDAGRIEKIETLTIGWFQDQQEIYKNAECGILLRYKSVLENKNVKKVLYKSMSEKGYIQLILDGQDREIRDENKNLVYRYFEANTEDDEINGKFGEFDMIRFE